MSKRRLKDIALFSKGSQINGENLVENGTYDYLNGGINPSGKWNDYNVLGNSITISEGGNSCGYVNYMVNPFWCGAHCYYLYDLQCDTKYLFYLLKSQQDKIMKLRSGACMPNIKKSDIGNFSFEYCEDVEIQHQITENLDKVTYLIDLCNALLEKLDLLVKAQFVEMFGGIHDSNLYPYQSIDSFTNVTSGGTPDRKNNDYWENGSIPWIKTTELHNNVILEVEENITEKGLNESSAKLVPKGTILIAMYGQGKTRGMTALLGVESSTNQACACILPCDKLNQIYLWKYLILSYDKLRNLAKGGNQPNLNGNIIKKFPVLVPPITLQNQFSNFVEQTDKSIMTVKQMLEKAEILKKTLMQKYFG